MYKEQYYNDYDDGIMHWNEAAQQWPDNPDRQTCSCSLRKQRESLAKCTEKALARKKMDSEEDSDFGGYDSTDDEDYVPEDFSGNDDIEEEPKAKRMKSPPKKRQTKRRRGMRFQKDEESEESEEEELEEQESEYEENEEESKEEDEEEEGEASGGEEKQRIDNIWESMKNDANSKKEKEVAKEANDENEKDDDSTKKEHQEIVKDSLDIKQGEANSEKSKNLKNNLPSENKKDNIGQKATLEPSGSKKRPGGISGVLGTIGKKQKISTLEKSKKDWETFKQDEGIADELRTSSKDGYLEKQEFLQRVDVRTWENERELRLATGRNKK